MRNHATGEPPTSAPTTTHREKEVSVTRRTVLQGALAATLLAPRDASAADYPARPVRVIVPYAPGGALDTVARVLAAPLGEALGQSIVIYNHPGGGGLIGMNEAAKAPPDGYTLLLAALDFAINRFLYRSPGYDPIADFAPVSLLCSYPDIMVVPASSSARTVEEFVDHARANPGRITFASWSLGASANLASELLKRLAHIEMRHIPYLGPAAAYNDVISGRVDVMFGPANSALLLMRNGKLRGLAVTAATRQPWAPTLPTVAESGLPDFEVSTWFALVAPARIPPEIAGKISADAARAVQDPDVVAQLDKLVTTALGSTPEQLGRHLKAEMAKWGPVIADMRPND
jgi:tripartite-type tricarboxylate transporter receptor subunit TctC